MNEFSRRPARQLLMTGLATSTIAKPLAAAVGEPWLEVATRSGDFIGVQVYRQVRIPRSGPPEYPGMPYFGQGQQQEMVKRRTGRGNVVGHVDERTKKPVLLALNRVEKPDERRRDGASRGSFRIFIKRSRRAHT